MVLNLLTFAGLAWIITMQLKSVDTLSRRLDGIDGQMPNQARLDAVSSRLDSAQRALGQYHEYRAEVAWAALADGVAAGYDLRPGDVVTYLVDSTRWVVAGFSAHGTGRLREIDVVCRRGDREMLIEPELVNH